MRNIIGTTKYAPVGNTGENINAESNAIQSNTKNNVLTGQVSRLVDGIFPMAPNTGNNSNISSLESFSSKSAALKSAFRTSSNSNSSNYQPQNILNHPNLTTLIPGIGGYQYEAVDKQNQLGGDNFPKETVEAKWGELQYYENNQWQNQRNSPTNTEGAFSSIASSGASSTASSSSSSKAEGSSIGSSLSIPKTNGTYQPPVLPNDENLAPPTYIPPPLSTSSSARKKFQEMKRQSMKKLSNLKSHLTGGISSTGVGSKFKSNSSTNMNSRAMSSYGVSTAPGGSNHMDPEKRGGGMLPRIRASKSMQNLEQITRDSYFNLRDKTTNLKAIYSSRIELRAEKPSCQYDELSDDDEDEEHFRSGKLDAGSDSDSDSGVGHTYDNLRKSNGRRMMNPIHSRFGRTGH